MKYLISFGLRHPSNACAEFHDHSASIASITPPPIIMQVNQAQRFWQIATR